LIALLGIYEPKECIDLLLSLRENWDLRNPKSSAYKIRPNQYQYRPLPIASLFYGIQKAMSRFEVENVDIVWLSEIVFPVLQKVFHNNVGTFKYSCYCTKSCL
jgi:hypothetical protein